MNKKIKRTLIALIILIPVAFFGWKGFQIYQMTQFFRILSEDTWQVEKQLLLKEIYSPDSTKKIGLYNYDSGALGYTAIQMSVVDSSETYPLTGNILMINRIPPSIEWKNKDSVFVIINKSNTPNFTIDSSKRIKETCFEFEVIATDSTYLKQYEN